MAEHWIDAVTARTLVNEVADNYYGTEALCARAHAGLVKSRARLLVLGDQQSENADVPQSFWRSSAPVDLSQDWKTGDFSTRVQSYSREQRWQAFGVTFALSGVLEMLPVEQRALATRRVSVAGNPAWMPARDVISFALKRINAVQPGTVVLEQARLGLIIGRVVVAQRFMQQKALQPVWEEREWDVPVWFWETCLRTDDIYHKWSLGQFSAKVPTSMGSGWMVLSGVHFLTESLQVLMPTTEEAAASAPPKKDALAEAVPKAKGERPPQPWWDQMWCAVWALIHQGDFKPKTKADIEQALLTWVAVNGYEVSDATVRPKAKMLFDAINSEARNFLDL